MTMNLTIDSLADLARGSTFLGCGGGGDPYLGRLLCENTIREYGPPKVMKLDDVPDDFNIFPIAAVGAPTVMIEKLFSVEDFEMALDKLSAFTGRHVDAVISAEAGGFNGLLPIAIAARRGIPVIDGDGVGRAVPEIQQTTYNAYGVNVSPIAMTNEHGETAVLSARNGLSGERLVRAMAVEMGLCAAITCYIMTGAEARKAVVPDVMSISHGIGRAIREGRARGDALGCLMDHLGTIEAHSRRRVLFEGKIADLNRETDLRGWTFATYVLASLEDPDSTVEIIVQNEILLVRRNGVPLAMVPDLIVMVDAETIEPITTETVRHGQRVKLLAVSVGDMLRSPKVLEWFGPRAFGLDHDYVAFETL